MTQENIFHIYSIFQFMYKNSKYKTIVREHCGGDFCDLSVVPEVVEHLTLNMRTDGQLTKNKL